MNSKTIPGIDINRLKWVVSYKDSRLDALRVRLTHLSSYTRPVHTASEAPSGCRCRSPLFSAPYSRGKSNKKVNKSFHVNYSPRTEGKVSSLPPGPLAVTRGEPYSEQSTCANGFAVRRGRRRVDRSNSR